MSCKPNRSKFIITDPKPIAEVHAETEQAVLSGVILSPEWLSTVRQKLRPEDFESQSNGVIFEAACAIADAGKPVDYTTVANHLNELKVIPKLGDGVALHGLAYLNHVIISTPLSANVVAHADLVAERARKRRNAEAMKLAAAEVAAKPENAPEILAEVQQRIGANDENDGAGSPLPRLGPMLRPALERARRRASGEEKPIALPWRSIAQHFGGGLWPGVHYLNASTGLGKTQSALQMGLHAARNGVPVAYIGLELEATEIALRVLGTASRVPWAHMFNGAAGPRYIESAESAIESLEGLPFHPYFGEPHGWPVTRLAEIGHAMRAQYPEIDGPGSRPILLILDFLQIVGDAPGEHTELRERIGRAAYQCRALAKDLRISILVISSIARASYNVADSAARLLGYELDESGCPIRRRVINPDALVGLGKESGEIEFSGDSISVLLKIAETADEHGVDVAFVTAKGRATGTTWSPLHFDGFRYEEPTDRGARIVEAWNKRETARQEKREKRQEAKASKVVTDAAAIVDYVYEHPRCPVREARVHAVNNDSKRWTAASTKLGAALISEPQGRSHALTVDLERLPADVAAYLQA